jgi:DNA-binding MarR family transcriptional regulator
LATKQSAKPELLDDPVEFKFFNEIGIIEQLARNRFERVLPGEMRIAHFGVLNHFARLGGERSLVNLARAFQVSKPAMTNTVQRLEASGFVKVRPDPEDGRGKLVSLTAAGLRARQSAIAALGGEIALMRQALPPEVFANALSSLTTVRQWLDENRPAATA